jgi:hypothetical protein
MAISHDAVTLGTAYTTTGTQTTSHVANASAYAALVFVVQQSSVADQISGITYGGTAMTRLSFETNGTESGAVYTYFLDAVSGGTQNVAMTTTGTAEKQLMVATMLKTASPASVVPIIGTGTSTSATDPTWNITGLNTADTYVAYEAIHSGLQAMTTTPNASWTLVGSTDAGTQGRGFARLTSATSGVSSITSGWLAGTADDFVGVSVALYEEIDQTAVAVGIAGTGGVGTPSANAKQTGASAGGIASTSVVGTPAGGFAGIANAVPIASTSAVGTPSGNTRTQGNATGIATGHVMGTPVSSARITANAAGAIDTDYEFGLAPSAATTATLVSTGVATASAVGTPGVIQPEEIWGFLPMG